jgi:hypothetical protein
MATFGIRGTRSLTLQRFEKMLTESINYPQIFKDVMSDVQNPISFTDTRGKAAYGYEADVLIRFCDAFLSARERMALKTQAAHHYAKTAEALVRAAAKLGIVALIDEATGYQELRGRSDLQKLLAKFLRDDLAKWTKTFPDEYYLEIARLKGWDNDLMSGKRPGVLGHITNDIVYARLAPGIIKELQKRNPLIAKGRRDHKHHQHMSDDFGYPQLHEHLGKIVFLMQACGSWISFERAIDRALPKYGDTLPLLLMDRDGELL